jgi:hypothetical protein
VTIEAATAHLVVDGSLHVTNGGVNPGLTIFANAYRIMHL